MGSHFVMMRAIVKVGNTMIMKETRRTKLRKTMEIIMMMMNLVW
jgi:hypothetical protein